MTLFELERLLLDIKNTNDDGSSVEREKKFKRVDNIKNATQFLAFGYINLDRVRPSMIHTGNNRNRYLNFAICKMPELCELGKKTYSHQLNIPLTHDERLRGEMEHCIGNMVEVKPIDQQNYEHRIARTMDVFDFVLKEVFYNCDHEDSERAKDIFLERIMDI